MSSVCVYNVEVTHCVKNVCFYAAEENVSGVCLQAVEPCSSLGPFPTGTLCQIERPSADRPRSSLDRVCVHAAQSVIVWSCMCAIVCINMGECTHV